MTSFEHYFTALKKAIGKNDLYEIWPDFSPQYDEYEYAWTTIRGLGEALLLNCGQCDGPSDLRHVQCKNCARSSSMASPVSVVAVVFSMPPKMKSETKTWL